MLRMQGGLNGSADAPADSRWMSYTELAEARRIATASAIKLVLRRGWRRQKDNHGIMRALVPPEWAEPAPARNGASLARAMQALEATIADLHERAEAAERTVETERQRADRAELARRAEYSRADLLRERIDALRYGNTATGRREMAFAGPSRPHPRGLAEPAVGVGRRTIASAARRAPRPPAADRYPR
jgi:hypothetical protein